MTNLDVGTMHFGWDVLPDNPYVVSCVTDYGENGGVLTREQAIQLRDWLTSMLADEPKAPQTLLSEAIGLIRVLVAYGHQPLPDDLVTRAGEFLAQFPLNEPESHIDAFLAMALPRIAELMQADPADSTPEGRELILLAELADRYEKQKYPEFAGRPVRPHSSGSRGPAPELPLPIR